MTELVASLASFKGRLAVITIRKLKEQQAQRKKQKWILHSPLDTDILVKYVFQLRRICPNYR